MRIPVILAASEENELNQELHELVQRAERSAAKAGSQIRKLLSNSPHASLYALEKEVVELQVIRNELADRTGRSALE